MSMEEIDPAAKNPGPERGESRVRDMLARWWHGDAHTHTQESTRPDYGYAEGIYTEEEILEYYSKLGLEFAVFSEHASKPGQPSLQSPDSTICRSLIAEAERITALNRERPEGAVGLSGVEANIMFDEDGNPQIDIPPEVLSQLDMVTASRHQIAKEKDPEEIKRSLIFAAQQDVVDMIGHPDRNARDGQNQDPAYLEAYYGIWPEILEAMRANNKAFEINMNSQPDPKIVAMAIEAGVPFFLNYDAHDFNQYKQSSTELEWAGERVKQRWAKEELEEGDEALMAEYKLERLQSGPGVRAIFRLVKWISFLEKRGVTPDRVINSSRERLIEFLASHGHQTENLRQLRERLSTAS